MIAFIGLLFIAADPPKPTPAWTPKDKEMVVLLGSAFIEQEARDGYLETELIRLFPNKDIRVRNLGWSGDTVHCQARAYFGPPQEGFDRLRGHLQMIKPTTVICCYGANESWKGEPGIPDFRKGYEKLIDMICEATGATVVLMTPPRFEPWGTNYMRLVTADDYLGQYSREVKYIADGRRCTFNDFGARFPPPDILNPRIKVMENGVVFSSFGYSQATSYFWDISPGEPGPFTLVDFRKKEIKPIRTSLSNVAKDDKSLRWSQQAEVLPAFPHPLPIVLIGASGEGIECRIDGKLTETRKRRSTLEVVGPELEQIEKLRQAIVKKNALFFHRWRPANETYLYGFRKHEQGNNGVEPPMFDKLVEQAEAEIDVLKKPVPHKYELVKVEGKQ